MAECNNYTGLQINPTPSSIGNQYAGVSTDEKPANAPTYSVYLELDTGKFYYYDGTEWKEVPCCGDDSGGGGGGGDFSTAEVTVVYNGSDEYIGYTPHIETFPGTGEEVITGEIILGAGESGIYTCVLYKGVTLLDVYGLSATLEGDAESLGDIVKITGNCTITLADGG